MKQITNFLYKNGNITTIGVVISLIFGLIIMGASLFFIENRNFRLIGASFGLMFVSLAGYSSRAKTLGLKLFNNDYKKARKTYDSNKNQ